MRLPEPIYKSVPLVYIAFGLITIYFGSEALWFGRGQMLAWLLFLSGTALVINGFLVFRARRKTPESRTDWSGKPV